MCRANGGLKVSRKRPSRSRGSWWWKSGWGGIRAWWAKVDVHLICSFRSKLREPCFHPGTHFPTDWICTFSSTRWGRHCREHPSSIFIILISDRERHAWTLEAIRTQNAAIDTTHYRHSILSNHHIVARSTDIRHSATRTIPGNQIYLDLQNKSQKASIFRDNGSRHWSSLAVVHSQTSVMSWIRGDWERWWLPPHYASQAMVCFSCELKVRYSVRFPRHHKLFEVTEVTLCHLATCSSTGCLVL